MRPLVTGGGGFLGSAIVRMLHQRGQRVSSFSRQRYPILTELGVEQIQGDLTNTDDIEKAVAGCDIVYHVAAKAGVWGYRRDYFEVNVTGTRNVLNACRKHGVRRLVYTSSPSVIFHGGDIEGADESIAYPKRFEAHYPETKAIAEQAVLAANGPDLATVALRPHLIWGPGDPHLIPRLINRARQGKFRRIGRVDNKVDVIYIDNAAHAHVLAGERLAPGSSIAGKAYFISQGRPVLLWDFINEILKLAKIPLVEKRIGFRTAWFAGLVLESAYRLFRLKSEPPMTRFVARQLATAHWFDITAARRDLGYEPLISTDEGLRRLGQSLNQVQGTGVATPS